MGPKCHHHHCVPPSSLLSLCVTIVTGITHHQMMMTTTLPCTTLPPPNDDNDPLMTHHTSCLFHSPPPGLDNAFWCVVWAYHMFFFSFFLFSSLIPATSAQWHDTMITTLTHHHLSSPTFTMSMAQTTCLMCHLGLLYAFILFFFISNPCHLSSMTWCDDDHMTWWWSHSLTTIFHLSPSPCPWPKWCVWHVVWVYCMFFLIILFCFFISNPCHLSSMSWQCDLTTDQKPVQMMCPTLSRPWGVFLRYVLFCPSIYILIFSLLFLGITL